MRYLSGVLGFVFWVGTFTYPEAGTESSSSRGTLPAFSAAERDSLLSLGEQQMEAHAFPEAATLFSRLIEANPEDAQAHIRLGYAQFKQEDYKAAETAFKTAKKLDKSQPEAYVGLGLVYTERPAMGLQALYQFRKAMGEAKRAIKLDPNCAPAYRVLGELHERFRQDHEKAIEYYTKYVELKPDNPDGLYHFGLACIQAGQYDKIEQYLIPYIEGHVEEVRLLPLAAQGHFFLEQYEAALANFDRYLAHLDAEERRWFTDISLVASDKEMKTFEALPGETERLAYLERFWQRRDPDILTEINERIVEHYRRVWYARTFFSRRQQPWDERGEVYIRYGEPDYRAQSSHRNAQVSPEVEAIRTRMAIDIYGPEAAYLTFVGPVFPIKVHRDPYSVSTTFNAPDEMSEEFSASSQPTDSPLDQDDIVLVEEIASGTASGELTGDFESDFVNQRTEAWQPDARFGFENYAPVTLGTEFQAVSWEAWTYTKVQGGIEFAFTDELGNGRYDFAPLPTTPTGDRQISRLGRLTEYAPGVVFERVASATPDYYRPGMSRDVFEFFYDLAEFRGTDGQTTLEVYYGIPTGDVKVMQSKSEYYVQVQNALALANDGHTEIYRTAEVSMFQTEEEFSRGRGAFVPDLLHIQVPPGEYELQVQMKDIGSGRSGLYKQVLNVTDYHTDALQISGIALAHEIRDTGENEKFRKGDVWVLPMPTRAYGEEQKVYAYFEIYNLKKDEFGQTRYEVQYAVRYRPKAIEGVLGSVASGVRSLFNRMKPQVSVSYEQAGTDPMAHAYVELDLTNIKPGINILEVQVTDQVSGENTTREVNFRYGGPSG